MLQLEGSSYRDVTHDRPSRPPPSRSAATSCLAVMTRHNKKTVTGLFLLLLLGVVLFSGVQIDTVSLSSIFEDVMDSWAGTFSNTPLSEKKGGRSLPRSPFPCPMTNKSLTCDMPKLGTSSLEDATPPASCPDYFRWIHEDLRPWKKRGITRRMVQRAGRTANFRLLVVKGRLYVESYSYAFQTRDTFGWWGFVQLLRKYPGRLPDLDLMFDCDDIPVVHAPSSDGVESPLPLFSYCKDTTTLNIPFPDWSFWGWSEVNIKPWVTLTKELREANMRKRWMDREAYAFWKGNPSVSWERGQLLTCNLSLEHDWNARLFIQDWVSEINQGFKSSNLVDQCTYRYKIYIEGRSWSVSQKYILACDSLTLLVTPRFHDFFTRGLIPLKHYWPINTNTKCSSIKFAVDWGNSNQDKAQDIGRNASNFMMEELKMDHVYDYMFHLLNEYAKLLRYTPRVPPNAVEVCMDSMLCSAEGRDKSFMMDSQVNVSQVSHPCSLPPPFNPEELQLISQRRDEAMKLVEGWEHQS